MVGHLWRKSIAWWQEVGQVLPTAISASWGLHHVYTYKWTKQRSVINVDNEGAARNNLIPRRISFSNLCVRIRSKEIPDVLIYLSTPCWHFLRNWRFRGKAHIRNYIFSGCSLRYNVIIQHGFRCTIYKTVNICMVNKRGSYLILHTITTAFRDNRHLFHCSISMQIKIARKSMFIKEE